MSPRSAEFLDGARRRLAGARGAVDADPSGAISAAYYAMFYAARAALSERDTYAKTHSGTWHLFQEQFVDPGQFDPELLAEARKTQRKREDADYQAWAAPKQEAERAIELAARFLGAIEELIAELEQA